VPNHASARSLRDLSGRASIPEGKRLGVLLGVCLAASLLHFAHNAEFLGDYPNLPYWLTRSQVYLTWTVLAAIGVGGFVLYLRRWPSVGLWLMGLYAVTGFDGLLHYSRAPFHAHTAAMNFTIWFEVIAAAALLVAVLFAAVKRIHRRFIDASTIN
jgi:hypothetical protein